jgi:molybdate transport system ATP-binding protein
MIDLAVRGRVGAFAYDLAFTGPSPGVTAVLGASGAGKTTLLRAVAGLARPASGHLRLSDTPVFDLAAGFWPKPEARGCGVVFQDGRLFPHLTVEANLMFGLKRAGSGPVAADAVIAAMGVEDLLGRRPATLSAGERQRVAIGRALLSQARLLLMDEPLANLDAAAKRPILAMIAALPAAFGVTVLYVTHALDEAAELADAVALIEGGRCAAFGAIGAMLGEAAGPFAARHDARTVWRAQVLAQDAAQGVARLKIGSAEVRAVVAAPEGATLRLQIFAEDVILARSPPPGLSLRNCLAARVQAVAPRPDGTFAVALSTALGPDALLAAVTRGAAGELGLVEGATVYALFKAARFSAQA